MLSLDALDKAEGLSGSPYWFFRLLAESARQAILDSEGQTVGVRHVAAARVLIRNTATFLFGQLLAKPLETLTKEETAVLVANGLVMLAPAGGDRTRIVENPLLSGLSNEKR